MNNQQLQEWDAKVAQAKGIKQSIAQVDRYIEEIENAVSMNEHGTMTVILGEYGSPQVVQMEPSHRQAKELLEAYLRILKSDRLSLEKQFKEL